MNKDLMLKEKDKVTVFDLELNEEGLMIIEKYSEGTIAECEKNNLRVLKVERPKYETIYEAKEILDEKEKKYLSYVIRPFINRVKSIKKISHRDCKKCWIKIKLTTDEGIHFPFFKEDKMYKGMKINREYTLEELGL